MKYKDYLFLIKWAPFSYFLVTQCNDTATAWLSLSAEIGQRQFYAWMTFGHFNCDFSSGFYKTL